MRDFFQPTFSPPWLGQVLTSIRRALSDIWPTPLRLKDYPTADLPDAATWVQGIVYDNTSLKVSYSNGSAWIPLSSTTGTVTTVSVATANGVSGTVATATTTPAITLTLGAITPTSVAATTTVKTGSYTVATLPAAATAGAGARAYVTDALAPTFLTAIVGGGAIATPVFSDGTNWRAG